MKKAHRAFGLTILIMLLRSPVSIWLNSVMPAGDEGTGYVMLIIKELLFWGIPALLLRPERSVICVRKTDWLILPFAGAASQWVLAGLTALFDSAVNAEAAPIALPSNAAMWVVGIIAMVIVPAAVEEYFFRGMMFDAVKRAGGRTAAVLITGIIFALVHGKLASLPAHLGLGLLLGLCMDHTGSITACMLLHGSFNAAALIMHLVDESLYTPLMWISAAVLGGFVLLMLSRKHSGEYPKTTFALLVPAAAVIALCAVPYIMS